MLLGTLGATLLGNLSTGKRVNGVYPRNNLPKLENGTYVITLD